MTTEAEPAEVFPESFNDFLFKYYILERASLIVFLILLAFILKALFQKRPIPEITSVFASLSILLIAFATYRSLRVLWVYRHTEIQGLFHPEAAIFNNFTLLSYGIGQTIALISLIILSDFLAKRRSSSANTLTSFQNS